MKYSFSIKWNTCSFFKKFRFQFKRAYMQNKIFKNHHRRHREQNMSSFLILTELLHPE